MFATLRQRNFALLWSGGLISLTGDWVLMIGLPIYVLLLTHSVLATSVMMIAARLPNLLFGVFAGVFVDRWNRQRIMVVGDALSALWLLPLLFVTTADRVWLVYIVAFVESSIEQFFVPAENALVPNLVSQDQLVAANSLSALSNNLARLVGPALGGLVAGFFGLPGIILVDAASFAIAGLLIAFIRVPTSQQISARAEITGISWRAIMREWLDGLRLIRRERVLGVLFSFQAITSLGEGVIGVLFIVFVSRVLHGGAAQVGWLMSAQAIGSLVGGVLIGWIGSRLVSRWWIGWCAVAFGLIDLVIFNSPAFFPVFLLTFALFVLVGLPAVAMLTGFNALQQMATPDAYRGRVSSTFFTTGALLGLLGTTIAGALGDHLGVVTVLNIQGGVYVLAGVLVLLLLTGPALEGAVKVRVEEEIIQPANLS
ncbi:MAG TPA: MFS transporter [Ktedonobacterales bacterium]|nr:MFS transporter [Ktedonobacterales bacterium]